jgi:hypothetical protein
MHIRRINDHSSFMQGGQTTSFIKEWLILHLRFFGNQLSMP